MRFIGNETIHKYALAVTGFQSIDMPLDAQILSIQNQQGSLEIWAKVVPNTDMVQRHFEIYGTGRIIQPGQRTYLATVQMDGGALVWHIFERA